MSQQVQISRGQMLVPQPRQGRHDVRRERAVPENVKSKTTQLRQIETTHSFLKGERQWIPVFEYGT